jgi:hypothetical protein
MEPIIAPLIYLALLRLAVLSVGALCIYLGFQLLIRGLADTGTAVVDATVGGQIKIKVQNLAPGSLFALFGAGLVAAITVATPPSATMPTSHGLATLRSSGGNPPVDSDTLTNWISRGKEAEKEGNTRQAMDNYSRALRELATPMNNLAWLYYETKDLNRGLPLAELAVVLAPTDKDFLDTYQKLRDLKSETNQNGAHP